MIAHQTIQNWFSRLAKFGGNNIDSNANKARFTIFKFKLRTVDDSNSNFAGWIETNGIKRLCFGPGLSGTGTANRACTGKELLATDPAPDNS